MCGIVGIWSSNNVDLKRFIDLMKSAIIHRGPDDEGSWIDSNLNIAIGQRRLSIVDLSEFGHQPMFSTSGRYVISFNGEIYNYQDIRTELEQKALLQGQNLHCKGTSDTEVILHAVEMYGLEATIEKLIGMFAIAIFDREKKCLYLIRDRLGEKPLYYGHVNGHLVFSSELKSIQSLHQFSNQIDRDALASYFRYGYISAPHTIYQGIFKLIPGTILRINGPDELGSPIAYWSLLDIAEQQAEMNKAYESESAIVDHVENLLTESISKQMVADVPVGAFLSGGIDSSLIVSLMQKLNNNPINTFSIGFHERDYNEADEAKKVAAILGTNHTELYIRSKEAMDIVPLLSRIYDEPFADSSQIPTYLVSKLARTKVTVALSGDGGDELFGGYTRYGLTQNIWRKASSIPVPVKKALALIMKSMPPDIINRCYDCANSILPNKMNHRMPGDKLHKLADVMLNENIQDLYIDVISRFRSTKDLVLNSNEAKLVLSDRSVRNKFYDDKSMLMVLDMLTYLPDDILVKVDRAAMANSLETRAPMLDHRLVEYSLQVPSSMKMKDGTSKWPLRQVLYRYIPREIVDRPKMGFNVPIDTWLRGDLRDWAEELLDERTMREDGFLNADLVQKIWREHSAYKHNWQEALWSVIIFQMWLK